MNNLTKEIIKHILNNFGILEQKKYNLLDNENKTNELEFNDYKVDVFSLSNNYQNTIINLIGMNLGYDLKEYLIYFNVQDTPAYCLYYKEDMCDIYYYLNDNWVVCDVYLQATFLAGIEQLKKINTKWELNINNEDHMNKIKEFIFLIDNIYT